VRNPVRDGGGFSGAGSSDHQQGTGFEAALCIPATETGGLSLFVIEGGEPGLRAGEHGGFYDAMRLVLRHPTSLGAAGLTA